MTDALNKETLEYLRGMFSKAENAEPQTVNPLTHTIQGNISAPTMLKNAWQELVDLSPLLLGKLRYTGAYTSTAIPALVAYVESFPSALELLGFVNPDKMSCRLYLDAGSKAYPGRCDHTATVTLKKNAFYTALLDINGKSQSQKDMAEFLEDWNMYWRAPIGALANGEIVRQASPDNPHPDFNHASLPKAIKAIRSITIDSQGKKDSVVGNQRRELSEMEKVEARASGEYPLPETLTAVCLPYDDLGVRHIAVRLSVVTGKEGEPPRIIPRIVAQEALVESMGDEFVLLVTQQFEGKAKIMKGDFSPGK